MVSKSGRQYRPRTRNGLFRLLSASQTRACLSSLVLVTVVALSIHVQKSLVSLNVRSLISTKIFWFRCLILSRASGVLLPLTKSGWFDLLFELLQVARPRKSEAIEYLLLTDGKTWHSRGPQNGTASQQQKWLTSCLLHWRVFYILRQINLWLLPLSHRHHTGNHHICLSYISSPLLSVFARSLFLNVLCPGTRRRVSVNRSPNLRV